MNSDLSENKLVVTKFDITATNALYSSLIGVVKMYINSLFPKNYFKYTYIKNSIASVTEKGNNDDAMHTKPLPSLSINMLYEPLEATFNGDSFLMSNMLVYRNPSANKMYDKILYDRESKIYISSMSTRAKHAFEITVTVNQEMEALNVLGYLRSKIPLNRNIFVNKRFLEVPIPMNLIGYIAKAKGFDLSNKAKIPEFNEMLLKHSEGRVVYKKHNSSGKFLYFYKFMTNLMFKVTSYNDSVEANKTEKSQLNTDVRFTIEVEYSNHNYYISEAYNLGKPDDEGFWETENEYGAIMHWTLQVPELNQLPDGKKLVSKLELVTELNSSLDSTIFSDSISRNVFRYMEYLKESNPLDYDIKLNKEFTFKLLCDGNTLELDTDYTINWSNYSINIINPKLNYDYKLFVFGYVGNIDRYTQSKMRNSDTNNNILVQN